MMEENSSAIADRRHRADVRPPKSWILDPAGAAPHYDDSIMPMPTLEIRAIEAPPEQSQEILEYVLAVPLRQEMIQPRSEQPAEEPDQE
jgi:hypothetical protein